MGEMTKILFQLPLGEREIIWILDLFSIQDFVFGAQPGKHMACIIVRFYILFTRAGLKTRPYVCNCRGFNYTRREYISTNETQGL